MSTMNHSTTTKYHLLDRNNVQYFPRTTLLFLKYVLLFLIITISVYSYLLLHDIAIQTESKQVNIVKSRPLPFTVDSFIKSKKKEKSLCSTPEIVEYMPDDPFIQKYTEEVSLNCNKTTIYTKLDQGTGIVRLTKESVEDKVSCFYSFLWRTPDQDNFIDYSDVYLIPISGFQMTNENDIANVSCSRNGKIVYKNTHLWMKDLRPKAGGSRVKGPSVVVIFLESLSYVNFNKYLKKAKISLENLGNVHYLKGFVKHHDNSFPNSMAFLTGLRADRDYQSRHYFANTYFDDVEPKVNYLWDDFSSKGYVTGFLEDLAYIGIFNYAKMGWKKEPTDWYPRAYWDQMYPEPGSFVIGNALDNKEQFCFNDKLKIDIFLDQIYNFMDKMKKLDQQYFLYTFYCQVTHNDANNNQIVDEPFANFFTRTKGMFNDTLLIFAGDHGPRYGSASLHSAFGRLEERMNLVSIRVPESLDSKYPHLRKFLTANENRLTSWPDIHSLVKDITEGSYEPVTRVTKKIGPISPWRELVHPNRTCDDAYIFPAYCVCNGSMNTDFRNPDFYDMYWSYKTVEEYVNKLITGAKDLDPEIYGSCNGTQKVNTKLIDMKYILPKIGKNFMIDKIKIKVFLEPANMYLTTNVIVQHHENSFSVMDDKFRILKTVCKQTSVE